MARYAYRGLIITVTLIETDPETWEATAYDDEGNVVAGPFEGGTEAVALGLVVEDIDRVLGPNPNPGEKPVRVDGPDDDVDPEDDPEDGPSGPRV